MQVNGTGYPPQPLPYQGVPQLIQPSYPGFNGASQPTQYNRKAAIGIGTSQMIIGIICFILNSILIDLNGIRSVSFTGYGIWGGVLFFIAGLLQAISGSKLQNKCLIIAAMVMCIIAACVSSVVFAVGIVDAAIGDAMRSCRSYNCYYGSSPYGLATLVLGSIIAILAFIDGVIAIIGSAFCCGVVCCSKSSNMTAIPVYFVANQPFMNQGNNNHAIILPPGQSPFSGQQIPYNPLKLQ